MRFDSIIQLQKGIPSQSGAGLSSKMSYSEPRKTFAMKKSVRQSEFYQAASTGFKPELVFILWTREYRGEERLLYGGKVYSVIRSYERSDQMIELTCEVKIGG